jgi:putative peptidoglycan lipid II flippase
VKVLAPGFYARQDIRTPVKIAVVTLVFTQLLNLLLIWDLRHAGLALSISLGACLNAALLLRGLRRRAIYTPQPGWRVFIFKLVLAVYVMGAVLWVLSGNDASWLAAGALERIGRLAMLVVAGSGAYFVMLWLLGFRPGQFNRRGAE